MQGLGSRPDDEAHLPWAVWFQEGTDGLQLPVKDSKMWTSWHQEKTMEGKWDVLKTTKGSMRQDFCGMMSERWCHIWHKLTVKQLEIWEPFRRGMCRENMPTLKSKGKCLCPFQWVLLWIQLSLLVRLYSRGNWSVSCAASKKTNRYRLLDSNNNFT